MMRKELIKYKNNTIIDIKVDIYLLISKKVRKSLR